MSKFVIVSILFALLSLAVAAEEITACAKYRAGYGWSEGYKVTAHIYTGSELNSATTSYDYAPYSTYTVIFWGPEQASIIEMNSPYISYIGTQGEDQEGRVWEIAETSICY